MTTMEWGPPSLAFTSLRPFWPDTRVMRPQQKSTIARGHGTPKESTIGKRDPLLKGLQYFSLVSDQHFTETQTQRNRSGPVTSHLSALCQLSIFQFVTARSPVRRNRNSSAMQQGNYESAVTQSQLGFLSSLTQPKCHILHSTAAAHNTSSIPTATVHITSSIPIVTMDAVEGVGSARMGPTALHSSTTSTYPGWLRSSKHCRGAADTPMVVKTFKYQRLDSSQLEFIPQQLDSKLNEGNPATRYTYSPYTHTIY
ncbi:hypothetical protein H6P81_002816 [Aristolochia fimbriata]|uniref:Uncharacterized protein n=1 Tax=Aristolochia fimbriata TaxID=158543 RepID=A0AAV7FBI8_ARIFI|nr:hypothetical protein H6P81_002816 [Aristolochia fimbriata]